MIHITSSVRWYVGSWAAGAALLLIYLFASDKSFSIGPFVLLLALLLVTEARPVALSGVDGKMMSVTLTFMVAMGAIIKMSPHAGPIALASGLAVFATLFDPDHPPGVRLIFNASQSAASAGLAATAFRVLGGASTTNHMNIAHQLLAVAAATAVYFMINSLAVTGAISLSKRVPFVETWYRTHGWLAISYVAFGATGIVLAGLADAVGWLSIPLILVPLLVARRVFRAYDEVSEAYKETVRAFVSAIEAKDSYTRGHSERVAEYAMKIARGMGMRDESLESFYYGALLHDVGKLAVRKSVLTKPSGLEDDEFAEIKRHPVLGAQIVQEIEFLRPALDAVLYHHERMDGSGYPAGLAGDIVPEWARIMAVADTYDAMTSTRAYRGARTHEEAVAELLRCSGKLFDPKCVRLFLEAMDAESRVKEIRKVYEPVYETSVVPEPVS